MDVTNLKYNRELFKSRNEFSKKLQFVEDEIERQQESCEHVGVVLGHAAVYLSRNTRIEQCLFCGKKSPEAFPLCIHAATYMKRQFGDGSVREDRERRLLALQDLWILLAESYQDASIEELTEMMQEEIQKDEEIDKAIEKKLGYSI